MYMSEKVRPTRRPPVLLTEIMCLRSLTPRRKTESLREKSVSKYRTMQRATGRTGTSGRINYSSINADSTCRSGLIAFPSGLMIVSEPMNCGERYPPLRAIDKPKYSDGIVASCARIPGSYSGCRRDHHWLPALQNRIFCAC